MKSGRSYGSARIRQDGIAIVIEYRGPLMAGLAIVQPRPPGRGIGLDKIVEVFI